MIKTQVYLDQTTRSGSNISVTIWEAFVSREIATRIGAFTITTGLGYWESLPGRTAILTVVHTDNDKKTVAALREIGKLWKEQNDQESVLITTTNIKIDSV